MAKAKDKQKLFFSINYRLNELIKSAAADELNEETCRKISLNLSEIYGRSKNIANLIEEIAAENETGVKGIDYDFLLTGLVKLKIELYDEVTEWMKSLKLPLQKLLDVIEHKE